MNPRLNGHFVSAEIAGARSAGLQSLGTLDLWCDRDDDGSCYLLLYCKDVLQHAVVALRPDVIASQRVDQLAGHTYPIGRFTHAAFQHVADAKFLADLLDDGRLAFVGERRVPGDYEERVKAG